MSSIANLLASGPAELTAGKADISFEQEIYLFLDCSLISYIIDVDVNLCSCHDRSYPQYYVLSSILPSIT